MSDFKNSLFGAGLALGNVAVGMLAGKNQKVSYEKIAKLKNLIAGCTYPKNSNNYILKSCEDVLAQYKFLQPQTLTYTQNMKVKTFIELKGVVTVTYKGTEYGVTMNLMFPESYPTQAPFIRIINIDPHHYSVDQYYEKFQSKNDPASYLLSQLNLLKNWNFYTNILQVIRQAQTLMSHRFPFKKRKTQNKTNEAYMNNQYPGSNNNQPNNQSNYGFNNFNNPNYNPTYNSGYNPGFNQPGFNQPGYNQPGFNQPGFNQPVYNQPGYNQPGYNQPGYNQPGYNQPGYNQQGYNNPNFNNNQVNYTGQSVGEKSFNQPLIPPNQKGPQINDAIKLQIQDYVARNQIFIQQTKKSIEFIEAQHVSNLNKVQSLQILEKCLVDQNKNLNEQIKNLENFVKLNENIKQTEELKDFVKPANQISNQLLDLVSDLKAQQQTLDLLQSKFSEDQINLQTFLKLARKIEQQRFMSKVMIKKCMKQLRGR